MPQPKPNTLSKAYEQFDSKIERDLKAIEDRFANSSIKQPDPPPQKVKPLIPRI